MKRAIILSILFAFNYTWFIKPNVLKDQKYKFHRDKCLLSAVALNQYTY